MQVVAEQRDIVIKSCLPVHVAPPFALIGQSLIQRICKSFSFSSALASGSGCVLSLVEVAVVGGGWCWQHTPSSICPDWMYDHIFGQNQVEGVWEQTKQTIKQLALWCMWHHGRLAKNRSVGGKRKSQCSEYAVNLFHTRRLRITFHRTLVLNPD